MSRLDGINRNAESFTGEVGDVNVGKGGVRGINNPFSCPRYALQGLGASRCVPHHDAAGQGTFHGAFLKDACDWGWGFSSSQFAKETTSSPEMWCSRSRRVTCTTRNFLLLTCSTVAPLMVDDGYGGCAFSFPSQSPSFNVQCTTWPNGSRI